jgi:hypothetical protein
MDSFYGIKLYEDLKNMSDCLYVDLDSESSDKMLYKCSDAVSKKLNNALEKKAVVEGFSSNCCPDGTTKVNNQCVEVCNNCKFNDCNYGSSNIGNFFYKKPVPVDKKEKNNLNLDENIFNYIVVDVPSN